VRGGSVTTPICFKFLFGLGDFDGESVFFIDNSPQNGA
jgi:hypothetical protein